MHVTLYKFRQASNVIHVGLVVQRSTGASTLHSSGITVYWTRISQFLNSQAGCTLIDKKDSNLTQLAIIALRSQIRATC